MKGNVIAYTGTGKVGNQVGYVRGGVQMFRAYQGTVDNPKSTKQSVARLKLGAISSVGMAMSRAIKLGYKAYSNTRVSARNIFFTKNYRRVSVNPSTMAVTVNFDELSISNGHLPGATFGSLDFSTSGKVIVPVTDGGVDLPDAKTTDKLVVVVYNPAFQQSAMSSMLEARDAAEVQVEVPAMWQGCEVHVYAFVNRDEGDDKQSSYTQYLGSGTLS